VTDVAESGLRRFRPYPEYKDSGVEWLGEVPEHWSIFRLCNTVTDCRNGIWGDEPSAGSADIACIRVADFDRVKGRVVDRELTVRAVATKQRTGKVLHRGDLLIEKSGGGEQQLVGAVVLFDLDVDAVCSNFVARMPVATGFAPAFLCYHHASLYAGRLNLRSIKQSIGIQNLDSASYLSELAGFPSLDEQSAIAAFLDRETARIDELVAKKERLIELLQEKRAALITRAVTKGLDPRVLTKDSGVEWLGEIPRHWEVKRIKWVAKMESGHTPDKKVNAYWEEGDIPWVSLNDTGYLKDHDYIDDTAYHTNQEGIANSSARLLPSSSVVFSRDATIGRCAITTCPMAVSQHFIAWICGDEVTPEYLLQVFKAMTEELERLTMGATIGTIGLPDVKKLVTPVLPKQEQLQIVDFIINRKTRIDALVAKVREAIERLKEYRTALISAAVTGKIDVREEVSH